VVRIEVERTFAAPRERVWERYTDHAGWTEWAGAGKVHLERQGEEHRDGVGCVRVIDNPGVSVREEVTAFEPPERMQYRMLGGTGIRDHQGEVLFEDLGERTRVVWRCTFEPTVPGSSWVLQRGVSFFFSRVLRRLARAL
jgi:uncharacterized protein YndB with AHSA1/START domain